MEGAKEIQLIVQQPTEANSSADHEEKNKTRGGESNVPRSSSFKWWLKIVLYTFLVLSGQAVATLLGRLYYDNGGNSKWMATLVQLIGFPVLLPLYFSSPIKEPPRLGTDVVKTPSLVTIGSVYVAIGLLVAADCYLYSVGLMYLPVSTYSLICASQLAFNSFFSYFLNSQKFTPFVVNSLFLLTMSSTLLVFSHESQNPTKVSKGKYVVGFVCTVGASAGYGLLLSLIQLTFQKVLKKQTFSAVLDMIIFPTAAASCAIVVGLFASGEWKNITGEMESYKLGNASYVMTLLWVAASWQLFNIGSVGLIFEVSSLFSNAISVLGLPVVPILAVFVFHDKMGGLKVISLVSAVWGFVSYVYQQYLDEKNVNTGNQDENANGVPKAASTSR